METNPMRPVNLIPIGLALAGFIRPSHTAWAQAPAPSGTVITIAGNGVGGFSGDDGPALDASISGPYGSAIGPDGTLYFADNSNYRIRAIDPVTSIITTVAGNGSLGDDNPNDGPATEADLSGVLGIAVDRNALYIGDFGQNWVSKVDLSTNLLTRYAGTGIFSFGLGGDGGPATSAQIAAVEGVATDAAGRLSIADVLNYRIRQVDPVTGIITTLAGTGDFINGSNGSTGDGGPAAAASFTFPTFVAADSAGNVFVTDQSASTRIRRIDAITGIITTVAGGGATTPGTGPATDVNLGDRDAFITVDDAGTLFIASGNQVFKVDLGSGQLSLFAGAADFGFSGDGGPAIDARFSIIGGLTVAPGGGLIISDVDNARIRYIAPHSIHLSGDSGQTDFYLPWVSALSGDLIVTNNPNLSVIDMSSVTIVGGELTITDNTSATVINASALVSISGELNISGNISAGELELPSLVSAGELTITDNTSADVINASALVSVSGELNISGNISAGELELPSLVSAGELTITDNSSADVINASALVSISGELNISGNISAGELELPSLVSAGELTITDNTSAEAINAAALVTVSGDLDISGNGPATTVNTAANVSVGGDLTIETTGSGTFDVSGAAVGGNTDLTTDGYTEVAAATAGGQTAVTMLNSEATMEVTLPDGAFSSANPVTFSVERLPGGGVETVGGEMVTHLETYAFDFAIPTLNSAAELNFEIDLVALAEPDRLTLLDLLHESAELTLSVRGDAPGAELQLFDVCSDGGPAVDACVVVQWLDANRMLLDPLTGFDPSILRFEALVGHFSTYSVVAVGLAGDYNHNGVVNAADYTVWRDTLGQSGTDLAADGNGNDQIDAGDLNIWRAHFGAVSSGIGTSGGGSVGDVPAVPEPRAATLAAIAVLAALAVGRIKRAAPQA
ncbi:MAG: hypothetical protein WD851_15680 [Pirellulales bacterium]